MATAVETVGDRIARVREALGLSQREIGQSGSTYAFISRIENGDRRASWKALAAIADRLEAERQARIARDEHPGVVHMITGLWLLTGNLGSSCPLCQDHMMGD